MDLKSKHNAPVLTDPAPMTKIRLRIHSTLLLYSPSPTMLGQTISKKKILPSKLDDVCSSAWLESMASSSPPRNFLPKDLNFEVTKMDGPEAAYGSWVLKHPSVLNAFQHMISSAKGKQIALFLDYDGTLSPIIDEPNRAFMSNDMQDAVEKVAKCFPTAIISGRSRDKVFEFVGLSEPYYAGSHGMDIMGPVKHCPYVYNNSNCVRTTNNAGKKVNLFQSAREFVHMIEEVFKLLMERTKGIKGVKVEKDKFCVSVHYRLVSWKNSMPGNE